MNSEKKFLFNLDFQWAILRYTLTDKNGFKAVGLYKPSYFATIHQQIIADGIKRFFKKKKRVPDSVALGEEIRKLFLNRDYVEVFHEKDRAVTIKKIRFLCKRPVKEADSILQGCIQFASFTELTNTINQINVNDFSQYPTYSLKIQEAINVGLELDEKQGTFLISGIKVRQNQRQNQENVFPTPFKQINKSTNAGGYTKGSVIVVIHKGKGGKTKFIINTCRGYLKMKKKVLYIDLENGEMNLADRLDQSILKKTKKEILSGDFDHPLQKIYRRYRRVGAELLIRRLPALSTTTDDIQMIIDRAYNEHGFKADILVIDGVYNLGCLAGIKNDDNARIGNAYLDTKNLTEKNGFETCWTPHHTNRTADKRIETCYEANDTAKCIDVHRHIDAMWGINQNSLERENKVFRVQVVDQRDGLSDYMALFKDFADIQRIEEFSHQELQAYREQLGNMEQEAKERKPPKNKPINDI